MAQPVVHFEIIGTDPAALRAYYGQLFGWEFDTSGPVAEAVSQPGNYGFAQPAPGSPGIAGGVGGGQGYQRRTLFYVGVPDVEAALRQAEDLGGARLSGPHHNDGNELVVGFFADPEGNVVGVADTA